ncbi:Mechanosensitive ion channel [Frankineae bacterium MT45]|nr:Mechanosensitive ion channel [Frankineae bacterium MT45]
MKWHRGRPKQILPPATVDALRTLESRVRPDFRRSVVFGVLAVIALIVNETVGGVHGETLHVRLIAWGCAALVAIFGVLATRSAANEVARISDARAGASAAAALRVAVLLVGFLFTLTAVINMLDIAAGRFLVGGGFTAIILGIAGQQVLGNLVAGLVLLFSRPYVPGERVRIHSGALGGPHDGVVTTVGLLYTMVVTADGPLNIPNGALLAAAVGPITEEEMETAARERQAAKDAAQEAAQTAGSPAAQTAGSPAAQTAGSPAAETAGSPAAQTSAPLPGDGSPPGSQVI